MHPKNTKNGAKKGLVLGPETSPKSQKSEPWAQNVPQASRRGPQAPKILKNHRKMSSEITQNHENLVTQNSQAAKASLQNCGTVAGSARSALDILSDTIFHFILDVGAPGQYLYSKSLNFSISLTPLKILS